MNNQEINKNIVLSTKEEIKVSKTEYFYPLLFLLGMTMIGLKVPILSFILVGWCLVDRYIKDKYDFIIQLTILFGGFSFFSEDHLPFKFADVAFIVSMVGLLILNKKSLAIRKVTIAMLLYAIAVFLIALTSDERMMVQIRRMRVYLMYFYFYIPLLVFANQSFDIKYFFKKLFIYTFILLWFYILDGYIFCGEVMLPFSNTWRDIHSTITQINCNPLSFDFPRMGPNSLYILALCIYPLFEYYKLKRGQWILVVLGLIAIKTLSVIGGLVITYIVMQGKFRQVVKYMLIGLVAVVVLYNVDKSMGSFMRVQSTIDQFISLDRVEDDEDLAEFGSGRMAQILPKMERLYALDREWLGFGFIHPEYTKDTKYWIYNELYGEFATNQDKIEIATGVETTQIQAILDIGYIGLLVQTFFFIWLYFIIKPLRHSKYYLSAMIALSIFGVGGMAGFTTTQGLLLLSLVLSVVVLSNKDQKNEIDLR